MKVWRRCHKQYDYKYNQRLAKRRPSLPLIRGSILGEMIDAHSTKGRLKPADVIHKYYRKYRRLFRAEKEYYGDILGECDRIFKGYIAHWADDPLKFVRAEALVTVDLGSDIRFIGYVDKIAEDKRKLLWILDHKSHKFIPNDEVRFSDLQTVFYVWAWNTQSPKDPVSGIIWDYLRTKPPTVPEVLKSGELTRRENLDSDYATYLKAIKDNKLDPDDYEDELKRLRKKESKFYKRVPLPNPNPAMIEQIVTEAKNTAIEIRNLGGVLADRNMTRECPHDCDFFELCQAELRGLDSNFVRKATYEVREAAEERHGEADDEEEAG